MFLFHIFRVRKETREVQGRSDLKDQWLDTYQMILASQITVCSLSFHFLLFIISGVQTVDAFVISGSPGTSWSHGNDGS